MAAQVFLTGFWVVAAGLSLAGICVWLDIDADDAPKWVLLVVGLSIPIGALTAFGSALVWVWQ